MKTKNYLKSLHQAQFLALLKKDILQTIQGKFSFFILRVLLPSVCILIIFITTVTRDTTQFTGLAKVFRGTDTRLPSCFYISDANGRGGLGSKISVDDCTLLAYWPENDFSTSIMKQTATQLNLTFGKDVKAVKDFWTLNPTALFGVQFDSDTTTQSSMTDFLQRLTMTIYYNQTMIDTPNFYDMYSEENVTSEIQLSLGPFKITPSSSFPLVLQSHLATAVAQLQNITYEPMFRASPFIAEEGKPVKPKLMLTAPLVALGFAINFIFTYIQLSTEKTQGTLEALRLAGVADIVYLGEQFVFNFAVFLLGLCGALFAMYGLPFGYDYFPYVNIGMMIIALFAGGLYSTCLALFINAMFTAKAGLAVAILCFTLFLASVLVYSVVGVDMLYDDTLWIHFWSILIMIFFPFALPSQLLMAIFMKNPLQVAIDYDQLDYSVQRKSEFTFSDFFKEMNATASSGVGSFIHPPEAQILLYIIILSVLFFALAWIFGEWIQIDASTGRPPWELFNKTLDPSFTLGSSVQNKREEFKRTIESHNTRRPLTEEQAKKCFAESLQQGDRLAVEEGMQCLINKADGNEVLMAHHIHKSFKRSSFKAQAQLLGSEHYAVQSVSLRVFSGEICGIAGHNGAGKSTALNVITGAIKMDKPGYKLFENDKVTKNIINNAWINQLSVRHDLLSARRVLGYCPQFNTNVYQSLTIRQNLKLVCELKNIPSYDHSYIVERLLRQIGLVEWGDKQIKQLSGGMQRRVSIAMALVSPKTKLIILDEPSTGLDPQTKRVIWSVMKAAAKNVRKSPIIVGTSADNLKFHRVAEQRPGVIITSHDMNELNSICDKIQIMSAGQIVAAGTSLQLKNRFGAGFTLTVVCIDHDSAVTFNQEFTVALKQGSTGNKLELLDQSGSTLIYSVENDDQFICIIIKHLEELINQGVLVDDYYLERTSLDEVFVKLAKQFELANGNDDEVANNPNNEETVEIEQHDFLTGVEKMDQIEFAEDESVDEARNKKISGEKLSDQKIQEILAPKRVKPHSLLALFYKLFHSDELSRRGIYNVIIVPIILTIIAFILSDVLLTYFNGVVNKMINENLDNLDKMCTLCEQMRSFGLTVPNCKGYDPWGFPNLCQMVNVQQREQYQAPTVYYGGDASVFNTSNLYDLQEEQLKLMIFDKRKLLGNYSVPTILADAVTGQTFTETTKVDLNGSFSINVSQSYYKVFDQMGYPASPELNRTIVGIIKQIMQENSSVLGQLPIKPIAIQDISDKSEKLKTFQIKADIGIFDAYAIYDSEREIDDYFLKFLRMGFIPYSGYKVAPDEAYQAEIDANQKQLNISNNGTIIRPRIFLHMNDSVNLQDVKKQVAQKLPLGYVTLDNNYSTILEKQLLSTTNNTIYAPMISSFLPARQNLAYYSNYQINVGWLSAGTYLQLADSLNTILSQNTSAGAAPVNGTELLNKLTQWQMPIQMVPTKQPTIIKTFFLDSSYVSPNTPIMDISTRILNGILRSKVNDSINLRFGVQMYPSKTMDVLDTSFVVTKILLSSIFITIASFANILKFGYHIVQDRQTGMRRSLYLNGVTRSQYWITTLVYSFVLAVIVQILVVAVGLAFRITVIQKMPLPTLAVIMALAALGSVATSVFVAAFFQKTSMFSVAAMLVLAVSAIGGMLNSDGLSIEPPAYGYAIPPMTFTFLLSYGSYFAREMSNLGPLGPLAWWMAVESVIMIVLAIWLDGVLPLNGYDIPGNAFVRWLKRLFKSHQQSNERPTTTKAKRDAQLLLQNGLAINEENEAGETDLTSFVHSKQNLNPWPVKSHIVSKRDVAAAHGESRMDEDVARERLVVRAGIPSQTPVVVHNLMKNYKGFTALRDLTVHIPGQSVFGILGPNGAAKTTLLHIMVGLIRQDAGRVYLLGKDMSDPQQAQQVYKNMGLCAQFDVYLPNLTVRQHLKLFAKIHGVAKKDEDDVVENLARFVCLGGVLDKRVRELSGGMKRRMSLALALIG